MIVVVPLSNFVPRGFDLPISMTILYHCLPILISRFAPFCIAVGEQRWGHAGLGAAQVRFELFRIVSNCFNSNCFELFRIPTTHAAGNYAAQCGRQPPRLARGLRAGALRIVSNCFELFRNCFEFVSNSNAHGYAPAGVRRRQPPRVAPAVAPRRAGVCPPA
jgi:hypothetical protein